MRLLLRVSLVVTVLVLPLLCGCSTWQKVTSVFRSDTAEPPPSTFPRDLQFADLPVPQGLEHDREHSFAYLHGPTRVSILRYSGNVSADDVVEFYRAAMPRHQWELEMVLGERENRKLQFKKALELCEVTVTLQKGVTYLTLRLGQR